MATALASVSLVAAMPQHKFESLDEFLDAPAPQPARLLARSRPQTHPPAAWRKEKPSNMRSNRCGSP